MRVVPIAHSVITPSGWELFNDLGFDPYNEPNANPFLIANSDPDIIGEFAGRACYESYPKPNPQTARNEDYLAHILEIEHESVLEHSTITLYVSGVSRNLLLELERHRHLSFSVISTRYVAPNKMGVSVHPNTPEEYREAVLMHDRAGRILADKIYVGSRAHGLEIKEAREVARQVLGGNTETKFVVTGNLRAWRYVINLRNHPKADKEIQVFAAEVLKQMKMVAPNSFQDM